MRIDFFMDNKNKKTNEGYLIPDDDENVISVKNDQVIDTEKFINLHPLKKLQMVSEQLGIVMKEPISNCKSCYGLGYVSIESKTKIPIPCKCIYDKKDHNKLYSGKVLLNRQKKRKLERSERRNIILKKFNGKSPTKKYNW